MDNKLQQKLERLEKENKRFRHIVNDQNIQLTYLQMGGKRGTDEDGVPYYRLFSQSDLIADSKDVPSKIEVLKIENPEWFEEERQNSSFLSSSRQTQNSYRDNSQNSPNSVSPTREKNGKPRPSFEEYYGLPTSK